MQMMIKKKNYSIITKLLKKKFIKRQNHKKSNKIIYPEIKFTRRSNKFVEHEIDTGFIVNSKPMQPNLNTQ